MVTVSVGLWAPRLPSATGCRKMPDAPSQALPLRGPRPFWGSQAIMRSGGPVFSPPVVPGTPRAHEPTVRLFHTVCGAPHLLGGPARSDRVHSSGAICGISRLLLSGCSVRRPIGGWRRCRSPALFGRGPIGCAPRWWNALIPTSDPAWPALTHVAVSFQIWQPMTSEFASGG